MGLSIGMLLLPIWVDMSEERFATFGYAGVFFANLASTATVFIPVPGLTAIGQALILQQGDILNPVLVGLLGGTGMALGEVTAYAAGTVGSEVVEDQNIKAPKPVRRLVERVIHWVDWLMDHYGFIDAPGALRDSQPHVRAGRDHGRRFADELLALHAGGADWQEYPWPDAGVSGREWRHHSVPDLDSGNERPISLRPAHECHAGLERRPAELRLEVAVEETLDAPIELPGQLRAVHVRVGVFDDRERFQLGLRPEREGRRSCAAKRARTRPVLGRSPAGERGVGAGHRRCLRSCSPCHRVGRGAYRGGGGVLRLGVSPQLPAPLRAERRTTLDRRRGVGPVHHSGSVLTS